MSCDSFFPISDYSCLDAEEDRFLAFMQGRDTVAPSLKVQHRMSLLVTAAIFVVASTAVYYVDSAYLPTRLYVVTWLLGVIPLFFWALKCEPQCRRKRQRVFGLVLWIVFMSLIVKMAAEMFLPQAGGDYHGVGLPPRASVDLGPIIGTCAVG